MRVKTSYKMETLPVWNELPSEAAIIRNWKNPQQIEISVICIAFNHEQFIDEALKGFLIQQTNVAFEVLLHDDASTDRTAEIIRRYEQRYPKIIRGIYQKENQHSKGIQPARLVIAQARGKYHAICEGDDYWVNNDKLQRQYDLLEQHKGYSIVFTGCIVDKQNGRKIRIQYPGLKKLSAEDHLSGTYFSATASLFFRREVFDTPHEEWMNTAFAGDFILKYRALTLGDIGYVDAVTCVYRKNTPGSWSKRKISLQVASKEYRDNLLGLRYLQKHRPTEQSVNLFKLKRLRDDFRLKIAGNRGLVFGLLYLMSGKRKVAFKTLVVFVKQSLFPNL